MIKGIYRPEHKKTVGNEIEIKTSKEVENAEGTKVVISAPCPNGCYGEMNIIIESKDTQYVTISLEDIDGFECTECETTFTLDEVYKGL
jgi:hypothetical protein